MVGVPHPGYTWRTFWDLFLEYLEFARRLETLQQQQQWLDEGHNYAIEALSMMSVSHKANLQALTDLISKRLTCALPYDATPCKAMREKMDGFEEMLEQNHKYRRFEAGRRGGGWGRCVHHPGGLRAPGQLPCRGLQLPGRLGRSELQRAGRRRYRPRPDDGCRVQQRQR